MDLLHCGINKIIAFDIDQKPLKKPACFVILQPKSCPESACQSSNEHESSGIIKNAIRYWHDYRSTSLEIENQIELRSGHLIQAIGLTALSLDMH